VTGGGISRTVAVTQAGAYISPPAIITNGFPFGTVGTAFYQALSASGGTPITWSIIGGALPNGLTLSANGVINGVPDTVGEFHFTVLAENIAGSDNRQLAIVVLSIDVPPPQPPPSPQKSYIFSTRYEATFINWILFFLCFGWLWMWF